MTDVSFGIGADNAELKRVVAESSQAMKEFFASITASAGGVGGALDEIKDKFSNAFEVVGATAAYEAISKIGEALVRMGESATQIKTSADVLGVTTAQFQAMQVAAEDAGVSSEVFTRATEKLVVVLNDARNGSSAAIDKLHTLGVTNEQIADPMFKVNDLLTTLNERLNDPATKVDTMNALLKEFGTRMGISAEAMAKYIGTAKGVADANAKINALTDEQIEKLHESGIWWKQLGTYIGNASEKMVAFFSTSGGDLKQMQGEVDDPAAFQGTPAGQSGAPGGGTSSVVQQAAEAAAQKSQIAKTGAAQQQQIDDESNREQLENIKTGIEAYKQGSAARLAAVAEYARFAQQVYGRDDVDVVVKANQQKIAETRAYNEAQKTEAQKLYDFAEQLDTQVTQEHSRTLGQLNALDIKQATDREKQLQELADFAQQLDTRVTNEHAKVLAQMTALNTKQAQEFLNKWRTVSSAVESGFTSAISGMIQGTETFSQAVKGIFTSIIDGLVSMFVRMGVEWAETQIANALITKTTAQAGIQSSAAQAGAAGIASFAGAPWPVDLGAPAFGAAMALEAASFAAASAAGGYDIPAGVNPVVQTHAREMILPATLADTVRNMATGSGKSKSGTLNYQPVGSGHGLVSHSELAETLRQLGLQFKLQRF